MYGQLRIFIAEAGLGSIIIDYFCLSDTRHFNLSRLVFILSVIFLTNKASYEQGCSGHCFTCMIKKELKRCSTMFA